LIIDVSQSSLPFEGLRLEFTASCIFILGSSLEVCLLSKLSIEISLESLCLDHESRVVILGSGVFRCSRVNSFMSSSELKVLGVSEFSQFVSSLLGLVEVIVDTLNSGVVVLAFSFLAGDSISKSIDLFLILSFFLSELGQLILKIVSLLSQAEGHITLLTNLSLE